MIPAGIQIIWRAPGSQSVEDEFEHLVVGSFEGGCSVAELPPIMPVRTNVLAETVVSRGGRVLPFFKIDCERVIQTLRPMLDSLSMPLRPSVFGRALARVIAHEIYHILFQTTEHDGSGVAKPAFSIDDLMVDEFGFDHTTLERMPQSGHTATLN